VKTTLARAFVKINRFLSAQAANATFDRILPALHAARVRASKRSLLLARAAPRRRVTG
jgi:hypothetical protein